MCSFPLNEGMERREAPGSLRGSLTDLARVRSYAPRFRDPNLRGGGGPGVRGPVRKALRLPGLHRGDIVGRRASLRHPASRSTTPSMSEAGAVYIPNRNKVSIITLTKHPPDIASPGAPSQGGAGAPEITPAMIQAGVMTA